MNSRIKVSPYSAIIKNLIIGKRIVLTYFIRELSGKGFCNSEQVSYCDNGEKEYNEDLKSAHLVVLLLLSDCWIKTGEK